MAEWFTQNRHDINGLSTQEMMAFAKDDVDTARLFAWMDNPPRAPVAMLREARAAVEAVFDDGPAAVVMSAAGLSRAVVLNALDSGRFDTVISDLDRAIRIGSERELPAAAALASGPIQRQAAEDAALDAQTQPAALSTPSEKTDAARQGLGGAEIRLVSTVQSPTASSEVAESIDRVQEAAQRYWQAATVSGRQINASTEQASQQQAGQSAEQAQIAAIR
ncbi:hypothetical protein [Acidiphilium sp.]|uniref:hypothetical protein n=1 Tax=Acidiphilium sp. TaxID=527 RepID=UPI003CFF688B